MTPSLALLPLAVFSLLSRPRQSEPIGANLNPQARELLGLPGEVTESLLLASLSGHLGERERQGFLNGWTAARQEHQSFSWDGPLAPGQPQRWLRLQLAPDGQDGWQGVLIDISDLREQAELSRHILNEVPIAIAISGLEGSNPPITFLNAEFVRRFGWDRTELRHLADWAERAYPDRRYREAVIGEWLAAVNQARQLQGSVAGLEFQVQNAWGEHRDVLFSGRVIGDELLVSLLDVTDRRRSERELGAARDALARTALEVTEAIPVGTYTMVLRPGSPLASFSFMSERFLQLTGLKREEALADPLKAFACVHPDDYDAWVQLNAEVFEKKLPFFGQTRVVVNGEVRWITAESVPRDLPDGTTVWEGVLIDVTERIVAQQQLEQVLNNIPVAIAINTLDPHDPEITFLNEHFIRSLGYSLSDLPRVSDWARLAYPDPAYRQRVFRDWTAAMARAMAHRGTVEQADYTVRSKDGRSLQMLISAVVLGDMALVALVDVTRSREAERQLLAALERERLQEQQLRKGIEEKLRVSLSASAVAHEISQPLASILINSQLALRSLQAGQPDIAALAALLEPIAAEAQRMDLITDRIRMLLRQVDTRRLPLDLAEVVASAALQIQPNLKLSGVNLVCDLPEQACPLHGDPVQLQLALLNLLRNAQEAVRERSQTQPRLELSLRRRNETLELVVADNGPGFPTDFNLELPLTTTKASGTGIGLYVVRLTAENHGGSLTIGRSERLGGAEVRLSLPMADPTDQTAGGG